MQTGRMPNRMQLRSVPPLPIGADRTGPDRAIIRVRAGHDEPLKPRTLAAVQHSINPQRARRARPGRSVSTWQRYDAYPMSPPPSRAHLVHPARSTDPAQLAQRLHRQVTKIPIGQHIPQSMIERGAASVDDRTSIRTGQ